MKVTALTVVLFMTLASIVHGQRDHVSGEKIIFKLKDASYLNSADGQIVPDINTGFRPFEYTWTGPDNYVSYDSVLYNLDPGIYVVRIEDALCGKFSDTIELKAL